MKALMILGAIVGFLIGSAFGLAGSSPWPAALWGACAGTLLAAVLTLLGSRVWVNSLRDALYQSRTIHNASAAEKKTGSKL